MNRFFNSIKSEKNYYLVMTAGMIFFFIVTMIQNVIRYGVHESYNPWISVLYLTVSLLLFMPFLPLVLQIEKKIVNTDGNHYWWLSLLTAIIALLLFFVISGALLGLVGFNDTFISIKYARQYFGRQALYHVLMLIGTIYYVYKRYKHQEAKLVSGMLGRKEMTVRAELIDWVEADDHYLRIHTKEWSLIKRSTLEQMSERLKPDFVRIHRKFLVNRHNIVSTERKQREEFVVLNSGKRLKVGRTYKPLQL